MRPWIAVALVFAARLVIAVEVPPHYQAEPYHPRAFGPMPDVAKAALVLRLPQTASVKEAIAFPHGRRTGSIVQIAEPDVVRAEGTQHEGSFAWAGEIRVDGAAGLRLHLTEIVAAGDAVLWVRDRDGGIEPMAIDGATELWTPSAAGESITLVVSSTTPVTFKIAELAKLDNMPFVAKPQYTYCLTDATCITSATFDSIAQARRGVAMVNFAVPGGTGQCTGTLLNDTRNSGTPYMLIANHCISTQAAATSVEAVWDYDTTTCGGFAAPPQRTYGATLLTTSAASDVTLLRLNSTPSGRWLLGWSTAGLSPGTLLHRLSHPEGLALAYSSALIDTVPGECTGRNRPNYLYSTPYFARPSEGSSGSAAILAGGYVVGQLLGACGPNPSNNCDLNNRFMDGAFSASWSSVSQWLNPSTATCTPNATTLCLNSNRFAVTVAWKDFNNNTGVGTAVSIPATADSGYFWFFGSNNVELVVKVLDARALNNKFWVFYGSLTSVEFTMTVRDTATGKTKTYKNASGNMASVGDTSAFDP